MTTLTNDCLNLFLAFARDAGNWNDMPLVGGNVGGSKAEAGMMVHIKKAGLFTTEVDEGHFWVCFTPKGVEFAKSYGIEITAR